MFIPSGSPLYMKKSGMTWNSGKGILISAHRMYHIFICHPENLERRQPPETDDMQTGIEWIAVKELGHIRILPRLSGKIC